MTCKPLNLLICLLLIALPVTASAEAPDAEISALRAELLALAERLDALEASNLALREENEQLARASEGNSQAVAAVSRQADSIEERVSSTSSSWADRIRLKGDFRMRYENIDEAGRSSRNRDRVRARAAIVAAVSEDVEVGLGLASGGDDPVSTNQTLGNGGSTKDLRMDLAYFKWNGWGNASILGGKFKNNLYKPGGHGMLWDGDWNPEGLGLSWAEGGRFVNLLGTWLESDSRNQTEFAWSVQGGFEKALGDGLVLTAGLGYHHFGTAGKGVFYGDPDDFFGNSFDPVQLTYLNDYDELELFAELGFTLNGRPAQVFLDYVQNLDAPVLETAYAAGITYGSTKAPGEWQFGYVYQDLEADAAFGLLSDSDFGGGGTAVSGHVLKFNYAIARNWNANFTYLLNERGVDSADQRDYDRMQLDLAFKY